MAKVAKKNKPDKALEEALSRAEADHFRDCPDAEPSIRFAALTLDAILTYLACTGLQHLCSALNVHFSHLNPKAVGPPIIETFLHYLASYPGEACAHLGLFLKLGFLYFYFVWPLVFSGGTAGQLLLGIRVLDAHTGKNLSLTQALLRQVLGFGLSLLSLGFGFFLVFLRPDHRALHDLIGDSVVKRIHGAR